MEHTKVLHPFCNTCGWRKGGLDSWDGKACKCGHSAPPMDETDEGYPGIAHDLETMRADRDELLAALRLLVADVQDYEAWQRPCYALDSARAALAKHAPKQGQQ